MDIEEHTMKNNENWPSGWWIFPGLLLSLMLILVTCTGCAHDPWSKPDVIREALYIGLSVVDLGQTLDMKNKKDVHEANPILGRHPSDKRIKTFIITTRAAHVLAVHLMPADWRPYFQLGGIAVEAGVVIHNDRVGLSIKF